MITFEILFKTIHSSSFLKSTPQLNHVLKNSHGQLKNAVKALACDSYDIPTTFLVLPNFHLSFYDMVLTYMFSIY